jgi:hypothetical protein
VGGLRDRETLREKRRETEKLDAPVVDMVDVLANPALCERHLIHSSESLAQRGDYELRS